MTETKTPRPSTQDPNCVACHVLGGECDGCEAYREATTRTLLLAEERLCEMDRRGLMGALHVLQTIDPTFSRDAIIRVELALIQDQSSAMRICCEQALEMVTEIRAYVSERKAGT